MIEVYTNVDWASSGRFICEQEIKFNILYIRLG